MVRGRVLDAIIRTALEDIRRRAVGNGLPIHAGADALVPALVVRGLGDVVLHLRVVERQQTRVISVPVCRRRRITDAARRLVPSDQCAAHKWGTGVE